MAMSALTHERKGLYDSFLSFSLFLFCRIVPILKLHSLAASSLLLFLLNTTSLSHYTLFYIHLPRQSSTESSCRQRLRSSLTLGRKFQPWVLVSYLTAWGVDTANLGAVGTWRSEPGEVRKAVAYALKDGYRHIDAAL